jgi:hypothetical protein
VIEASLRCFRCAYPRYVEEPVSMGEMVAVREGRCTILGAVASIESGPEDPTRPMQPRGEAGLTAAQVMEANPEIRPLLRTRVHVVICGHAENGRFLAAPPPVPPPLLGEVHRASGEELERAAAGAVFLPLLLGAPDCDDAVAGAVIRAMLGTIPDAAARHAYAVTAGKELARLLRADPSRMATIVRSMEL